MRRPRKTIAPSVIGAGGAIESLWEAGDVYDLVARSRPVPVSAMGSSAPPAPYAVPGGKSCGFLLVEPISPICPIHSTSFIHHRRKESLYRPFFPSATQAQVKAVTRDGRRTAGRDSLFRILVRPIEVSSPQRMFPVWPNEYRPGCGHTVRPCGSRPTGMRCSSFPVWVSKTYTS